jgi:hypothetical protein
VGVTVGHVVVGLGLGLSLAADIDLASQWAAVWVPSAGLGCWLGRSPSTVTVPAESKGLAVDETARTVAPNTEATTREATRSFEGERIIGCLWRHSPCASDR